MILSCDPRCDEHESSAHSGLTREEDRLHYHILESPTYNMWARNHRLPDPLPNHSSGEAEGQPSMVEHAVSVPLNLLCVVRALEARPGRSCRACVTRSCCCPCPTHVSLAVPRPCCCMSMSPTLLVRARNISRRSRCLARSSMEADCSFQIVMGWGTQGMSFVGSI
jgi:hypothetical protein